MVWVCSCTLLPRSPYNNSCVVLCALYCSVSFALVVHYAGVDVYMYIHTVHRAVLDQGVLSASFQVLSSVIHSWGIRIQTDMHDLQSISQNTIVLVSHQCLGCMLVCVGEPGYKVLCELYILPFFRFLSL